ncbi:type III PLP-dependent enzyme domain-containing protein [Marimonas lutisalis]|uniref:diaminopimelate decarboxylase n=1 Tax=Marimonas lutisalis TaxID=2545756 RepID=UPI0013756649|nr:diaminopimelate decarboxylase [Marimonas lutisalis]
MRDMNETYKGPEISDELGNLPIESAAERNPISRGMYKNVLDTIDGVAVEDLAREYDTPVFVFSERTVRDRARRMREAFRTRYADTSFAWSFKTNRLDAICSILKEEGWLAEVVSSFEYSKARHLGYRGDEIVFNGPYKRRNSIEKAMGEGALIQIDNWDELATIENAVEEMGGTYDVGIRIWFNSAHAPLWSKFGFNLANGEAYNAARRIIDNPALRLHTLHCHIGTYLLDPEAYRLTTQAMLGLRAELKEDTGHLVPCLNLGGGFPSYSLLHGMAGPAEQAVPPIESYAEAITSELKALPKAERPVLRLESGRFLVDNAGYLITSVVAIKGASYKHPPGSPLSNLAQKEQSLGAHPAKLGYVLDAGVNLLFTAAWFAIDASPSRAVPGKLYPTRLLGDLCMEIDVIRETINLPHLRVGDSLTLHPVGAYNFDQSMQFIHLRPAVVLIDENSDVHLIREREDMEYMESRERLPKHLTGK